MKISKSQLTALLVIAGILLMWMFIKNDEKDKKIKELEKEIDENENLSKEVKRQLTELIQNHKIDDSIKGEFVQIIGLLDIRQDTTAILKLAKIIENLLKRLYSSDPGLKEIAKGEGRKTPSFADYLVHARKMKVISQEDFHLISVLKIIRNEEAHELGVKKEKSRILAAFISGIGVAVRLWRLLTNKQPGIL